VFSSPDALGRKAYGTWLGEYGAIPRAERSAELSRSTKSSE